MLRAADRLPAALARRMVPGSRGAGLARSIANRLLPAEPVPVQVRSGAAVGIRLQLDPQREKFIWSGAHEPEVLATVVREVDAGGVVWDVGTHIVTVYAWLGGTSDPQAKCARSSLSRRTSSACARQSRSTNGKCRGRPLRSG